MNRNSRDLIEYAESIGYVYDGVGGDGHHVVTHSETGNAVRLPSSPTSDPGSLRGYKSKLRRDAGRQSDSPPAGKYRVVAGGSGFSMEAARDDRRKRAAAVRAVRAEARAKEWAELTNKQLGLERSLVIARAELAKAKALPPGRSAMAVARARTLVGHLCAELGRIEERVTALPEAS